MQSVMRYAGVRLLSATKPLLTHRATITAGPPKYPMSSMVSMASA